MILRDYYLEFKTITRLSLPLVISLLAEIGIQLTNSVMMGYIGTVALAAGALAIGISLLINMAMLGITSAAGILIASAYGAEKYEKLPYYWQQCLYLCLVLTVILSFFYARFYWLLQWLHQDPTVIKLTQEYLWGEMWGIFPVFGFWLFKEVSATLEKTTFLMWVAILGLPLNALLDYCFIFGRYGFPQWGMFGIGFSGSIVYWLMFALLLVYGMLHKKLSVIIRQPWQRIRGREIKRLLKMAWPISSVYFFEAGLFSAASVMMGWVGVTAQAAHQIVVQYIDTNYMIFLGVAQIAGLRIATYYGAEDRIGIHRSLLCATILTILISVICMAIYLTIPYQLIHLFLRTQDAKQTIQVIALAHQFLMVAVCLLVFDGLKLLASNALRGLHDTVIPMLLGLSSYWLIGIGVGYILDIKLGYQGLGIWIGLGLGIFISGVLLWIRWYYRYRKLHWVA